MIVEKNSVWNLFSIQSSRFHSRYDSDKILFLKEIRDLNLLFFHRA